MTRKDKDHGYGAPSHPLVRHLSSCPESGGEPCEFSGRVWAQRNNAFSVLREKVNRVVERGDSVVVAQRYYRIQQVRADLFKSRRALQTCTTTCHESAH